jgi:cation diffusion facilitator family transporter
MHNQSIANWQHEHTFEQDKKKVGEKKTFIVIGITAAMMAVEIIAGIYYGSMALLADGIHMGTHAAALGISAAAYLYARKRAADKRFNFGTGKVNALAGYTSAILLAMFAILMIWESIERFLTPVDIAFNQAIWVAVVGLVVNVVCVWFLNDNQHSHGPDQDNSIHEHSHTHADHNLRSAYLHVLADTLTSLLAIFALLGGKYLGFTWMDPFMGIVGGVLVARWSIDLIRVASTVLLDHQGPKVIRNKVIDTIESVDGDRVTDFHMWSIGSGIYAASLSVVTNSDKTSADIRKSIPEKIGIVHTTIEVLRCTSMPSSVP